MLCGLCKVSGSRTSPKESSLTIGTVSLDPKMSVFLVYSSSQLTSFRLAISDVQQLACLSKALYREWSTQMKSYASWKSMFALFFRHTIKLIALSQLALLSVCSSGRAEALKIRIF